MREHLELVRDGLLKVMTRPLPDHIDGEVQGRLLSDNTKKEIRHGT
jgi:hypothetical protein